MTDILDIFSGSENCYENEPDICEHKYYCLEKGEKVCSNCGKLIAHISYIKDWSYYGPSDTRHTSDPSRCHKQTPCSSSIQKLLQGKGFDRSVCEITQNYYTHIIQEMTKINGKNAIYRGNNRAGIVASCVLHATIKENNAIEQSNLLSIFGIRKKKFNLGMDIFNTVYPEYRTKEISSKEYVINILKLINFEKQEYYDNIIKLCNIIEKYPSINKYKPESLAVAIVYVYIFEKPLSNSNIIVSDFFRKTKKKENNLNEIINDVKILVKSEKLLESI